MAEQPALPTHPFGYGISADDAIKRIRRINAVSQGDPNNKNFMSVVVEELEMDFAMLREMDWESFMDAATVRMATLVNIVKDAKP
jgi:hypothetical protein